MGRRCAVRNPHAIRHNVSAQLKQFLDTLGPQWAQGLLADKVDAGFVSTSTPHGGQETTLTAVYNAIYHFGGIVVAPGETEHAGGVYLARRAVETAAALKASRWPPPDPPPRPVSRDS